MLYTNYKGENIYKESGLRNKATHIEIYQLDANGMYIERQLGILPIKKDYFNIKTCKTYDNYHWQKTSLNEKGFKYIERKIKHPGRGWLSFKLVDKKYIEAKKQEIKAFSKQITAGLNELEKL